MGFLRNSPADLYVRFQNWKGRAGRFRQPTLPLLALPLLNLTDQGATQEKDDAASGSPLPLYFGISG